MRGFPRKTRCIDCKKEFISIAPWNKRCGGRIEKIGCAYKFRLKWLKEKKYPLDRIRYSEYYKKYDREWKRNQRRNNPEYKKQCLEENKKWRNSEKGKKWIKESYKKYLHLKLENNRHRRIIKKGIIGNHTQDEWEKCKEVYNYSCAICKITESEIKIKWFGTHFNKLTKDHIVPVSKKGTEFINNIQPLCISCNAKKHNK